MSLAVVAPAGLASTECDATALLERYAATVHAEYRRSLVALSDSIDAYFAAGRALLDARRALPSDQAFGLWFREQDFGFSRQWAGVLRRAAEIEPEVRAAVETQVSTGVPNIRAAVKTARAALAAPVKEEPVPDAALANVIPMRRPSVERIEWIRLLAAEGLTPKEIGERIGLGSGRVSSLAKQAGIILGKNSRAARVERIERMRVLAREGWTSAQIADELGVVVEIVRAYGREASIEIPADATTVAGRRLDSTRIVEGAINTIDGIGVMFDHIDYSALPPAEVKGWLTVLDSSIRSLTTLKKHLKEMSQP